MCTLKSEHLVKRSRSVAITEEGKDNQQIVTSILMDPFQRQSVKRSTSVAITDLLLQSNQPTIASTVRYTLESYIRLITLHLLHLSIKRVLMQSRSNDVYSKESAGKSPD